MNSSSVTVRQRGVDLRCRQIRPTKIVLRRRVESAQYAAEPYRLALARSGITPSMSRKGDCLDNAPMESFFHSLKTERVHHRIYGTRAEARRDLFQYIEGFYNSHRLHSALGYISPAFAERMAAQPRPLFRGKIILIGSAGRARAAETAQAQ